MAYISRPFVRKFRIL